MRERKRETSTRTPDIAAASCRTQAPVVKQFVLVSSLFGQLSWFQPPHKMSLVESSAFTSTARPIKTTSLPQEAYVLALASVQSHYAASASAPSNAIHIFDKSNLRPVSQLAGHGEAISAMRAVPAFAGASRETLISCGKDGLVKVWDERSGSAAVQSKHGFTSAPSMID